MIVTRKDAEGNLKDQKYKNASGEPMNQKDAYTIVHLGGIDGPNSPTPNDKFIANEGTSGEYSNSLNITNQKSKEVVATSGDMSPGDKSYKSEGFVTQTNISGKSSTDMKVVVNTSVSALKKATGENLKMQITFSINPKNTILKNQINAVKSQIKNIPIIIIETNKQKINTSNMELVGVIPQKKKE